MKSDKFSMISFLLGLFGFSGVELLRKGSSE